MGQDPLHQTLIYLAASVVAVPLFKRLGLGAILGYLTAGVVIGPQLLALTGDDVADVRHFAEFGVVLLLFIIGLELKPVRLWSMRKPVFGLGGSQVAVTGALLSLIGWWLGLTPAAAMVAGIGLSLSSTAFVLQTLAEKKQLATVHGRYGFAILLFQDLAVIPLLAIMPLLADQPQSGSGVDWLALAKVIGALVLVLLSSRYLVRPLFRAAAGSGSHEVFLASALLVVLCTAALMAAVGLSMALGAFLAGVLLADSEYRHELEADIEPFKGLLLGLFFIAVGMSLDLHLLLTKPLLIIALTLGIMLVKGLVLFVAGRSSGMDNCAARRLALILPQGGEFAFVLFGAAVASGIMAADSAALLMVAVSLSMALMPLLLLVHERWIEPLLGDAVVKRPFDQPPAEQSPVIIAGFGRVGQIVARILRSQKLAFIALENDQDQVDFVRRFGSDVYYGDAARIDLLRAAGADKARLIVVALEDVDHSLQVVAAVRSHFPEVKVMARARNRQHAFRLMDLGVHYLIRETLLSSVELSRQVLMELGQTPAQARTAVTRFVEYDDRLLTESHKFHTDEQRLIEYAKRASQQLEELFEKDASEATTGKVDGG